MLSFVTMAEITTFLQDWLTALLTTGVVVGGIIVLKIFIGKGEI